MSLFDEPLASRSLIAPAPPPDLTGSISKLDDQYSECGSFGDVYRCNYKTNSGIKEVAVKAFRFKFTVVEGDGIGSDRSVKMVRRELGIWRRLEHDNIVPFLGVVYGFGRQECASLVSSWMPNGTLQRFLAEQDGELTVDRRLQLLLDIANGLDYLHSFPIIHGDLNSNNVLLDANFNARLADFGYASLMGETPEALAYLQMSTMRPGTIRWAAPEQISLDTEETAQSTTKSDIYSFGNIALQASPTTHSDSYSQWCIGVLWQTTVGKRPSRPQSRLMDDQYWHFIELCWANVEERPPARHIVSVLQHFLSPRPHPLLHGEFEQLDNRLPTSDDSSWPPIIADVDDTSYWQPPLAYDGLAALVQLISGQSTSGSSSLHPMDVRNRTNDVDDTLNPYDSRNEQVDNENDGSTGSKPHPRNHFVGIDTLSQLMPDNDPPPTAQMYSPTKLMPNNNPMNKTHNRIVLNNYLQEVCRDTQRLTWDVSGKGPGHMVTWLGIAYLDGVEWGRGQGPSRGAAMEAAAERVLNKLGVGR
ncbi:kinase-like domain-containing protein [Melanogaster broomeanus]|nr:kinase-like domain-containing protein [Melanogaster broomeanus]